MSQIAAVLLKKCIYFTVSHKNGQVCTVSMESVSSDINISTLDKQFLWICLNAMLSDNRFSKYVTDKVKEHLLVLRNKKYEPLQTMLEE